jgi:hypothetical protein
MLESGIVEALLGWRAGEAVFLVFHGFLSFPCLPARLCESARDLPPSKRGKLPNLRKIAQ